MTNALYELSVSELSAGLAARRFSPVDVVEAHLSRIAALEPRLHAFVEIYGADARMAAEAADKAIRSGHGLGPLHGIPIAIKDLVEVEGRITTGGSPSRRNTIPAHTATLARKLIGAGMVMLGKTHTVEFAYGAWGTNQHMGTPVNPWDLKTRRTPGGSSSGSGVAVAARMAPCAIGSDTGGSVRIPSSWCGITGLKVSIGRISTFGVLPLCPTLDTPGPLARTVEDCAILLAVMQGTDPRDPLTMRLAPTDPFAQLKRGVKGLTLARMPDSERANHNAEVLASYDRSLKELEALGAEIVELTKMGRSFKENGDLVGRIISAEIYPRIAGLADDPGARMDEAVRARVLAGKEISARQYLDVLAERERRKQEFASAIEGIDAVLSPSTFTPAIPLTEVDQTGTPAVSTRWVNFLDLCALSVPNGLTAGGLPTSLQIVCRDGDEACALRIGWALENVTGWHKLAPKLD
ncbi:MAG TPA: amidase [Rhizomicrobium sp.]|jgi:aspartyl-tRNA(Asn)/glutamyl-tRNA(Gln) amidotransferase subunit A|nr:amidase [Rhizomicrobium sp.]